MARCSFCGDDVELGTGKMFVKKDGAVLHFCSMKCEKNMLKLKRNPIKTPWTYAYKKFKGKLKVGEEKVMTEEKVKSGPTPKMVDGGDASKEEKKPAKEAPKEGKK
ncbi:MAG: 50S ribosomal protein L24e [archaeon]